MEIEKLGQSLQDAEQLCIAATVHSAKHVNNAAGRLTPFPRDARVYTGGPLCAPPSSHPSSSSPLLSSSTALHSQQQQQQR